MRISVLCKMRPFASFVIFCGRQHDAHVDSNGGRLRYRSLRRNFSLYDADTKDVLTWDVRGPAAPCPGGPPCGGFRRASAGGTGVDFDMESSDLFNELPLTA
jgi:hypothetical protein